MPLIGPGIDERPRASRSESRLDLARERCRLSLVAVANAVETHLGHHERPIAGDVLQAGDVGSEARGRLQVNIEGDEVQEWQLEVLRRRVVNVGYERSRVLLTYGIAKTRDEALHSGPSEPTHDRGGYLVGHRVAEDGRMAGALAHPLMQDLRDRRWAATVVQVAHVALRSKTHHHS